MGRLIAVSADEHLSSTQTNVAAAYYGSETEVPGVVVLSGTNKMPNPDLTLLNSRGRLRGWNLKAPPSPDSWNVYMKQLTRILGTGAHQVIEGGAPMLRQNEEVLP